MGKHTSLLDMYQVLGDAVEVLLFWFLFEETLLLTNLAVSGMVE